MNDLYHRVKIAPDEAKTQILAALHSTEGDREQAAKRLGVSRNTLYRYIQELRMYGAIDEAMDAWGFDRVTGPPRVHT